jgi:Ca2+-binding EF-hand superfamily protein
LNDAILKVQEDNDVQLTQAQTRALVKSVFNKADASQSGIVSRAQIRKALNKSIEQVSALQSHSLPADDTVVSKILHTLEKSKSNEISSEEVAKAIQQVAAANHTVVDEE